METFVMKMYARLQGDGCLLLPTPLVPASGVGSLAFVVARVDQFKPCRANVCMGMQQEKKRGVHVLITGVFTCGTPELVLKTLMCQSGA